MTRSEEITSEVRRLVLTCRSMEAQLQQSMPKKTHQEVVEKMQAKIDELTGELETTRSDLERSVHLEEGIKSLSQQIAMETQTITGQFQSNDAKRIQELETKISGMVDRSEFEALQAKYEQLANSTVPKDDYNALQNQFTNFVPKQTFEDMQRTFKDTTVPREQLSAAETRLQELEAKLANSVPSADHEELMTKLTSMIGEAPHVEFEMTQFQPNTAGTTEVAPVVPAAQ